MPPKRRPTPEQWRIKPEQWPVKQSSGLCTDLGGKELAGVGPALAESPLKGAGAGAEHLQR